MSSSEAEVLIFTVIPMWWCEWHGKMRPAGFASHSHVANKGKKGSSPYLAWGLYPAACTGQDRFTVTPKEKASFHVCLEGDQKPWKRNNENNMSEGTKAQRQTGHTVGLMLRWLWVSADPELQVIVVASCDQAFRHEVAVSTSPRWSFSSALALKNGNSRSIYYEWTQWESSNLNQKTFS